MPLITNASGTAWTAASATTTRETWQCRSGGVLLSTAASPAATEGIYLAQGESITFASVTVQYRRANDNIPAVIAREITG